MSVSELVALTTVKDLVKLRVKGKTFICILEIVGSNPHLASHNNIIARASYTHVDFLPI